MVAPLILPHRIQAHAPTGKQAECIDTKATLFCLIEEADQGFIAYSLRDAPVDQLPGNVQTIAVPAGSTVAPKPLRAMLAPWMAELAILLLRLSAVALLLSPFLLIAALLLR